MGKIAIELLTALTTNSDIGNSISATKSVKTPNHIKIYHNFGTSVAKDVTEFITLLSTRCGIEFTEVQQRLSVAEGKVAELSQSNEESYAIKEVYQNQVDEVDAKYESKITQLNEVIEKLTEEKEKLSETIETLSNNVRNMHTKAELLLFLGNHSGKQIRELIDSGVI